LLPDQAKPILNELDEQWALLRDQECHVNVPSRTTAAWVASVAHSPSTSDCLIRQFQNRAAQLLVQRRFWEEEKPQAGSVRQVSMMASSSPALDPAHDGQVRAFWRWVHSFRDGEAPSADPDGSRCAQHQSGPLWFLAGNARGGMVRRTCEVAQGTNLVVPILAVSVPTSSQACASTRLFYYRNLMWISVMDVTVDGAALPRAVWPRMHMACMPHPDGERYLLVAGWWLYLDPLTTGEHHLEFNVRADGLRVQQDVKYVLSVQ
jgi:hypothetical protein